MDALETINTRRSIRKYEDRPVPDDVVAEILKAAMSAPSAGNEQPWHFIVIKKRDILDQIPKFHPYAKMIRNAPLAIAVCADLELEKHRGNWISDCAAATENLLLAAHAMGIGAVWTAVYPRRPRIEGLRKLLGIPGNVMPLALVPMGYPGQENIAENRFKPERIHYNAW